MTNACIFAHVMTFGLGLRGHWDSKAPWKLLGSFFLSAAMRGALTQSELEILNSFVQTVTPYIVASGVKLGESGNQFREVLAHSIPRDWVHGGWGRSHRDLCRLI